jgi:hypothetical protein
MDNIQGMLLKRLDSSVEKKDKQLRNELRGKRKRGGNTRTKREWRSESVLKQYAVKVNERRALAICIKDMFDRCEGEAGWLEDLNVDRNFRLLSSDVPGEIISWAVRRVASEDLPAREREPLSVACEMARRELTLPEQNIETLRDYYGTGEKLRKKERNQKPQ